MIATVTIVVRECKQGTFAIKGRNEDLVNKLYFEKEAVQKLSEERKIIEIKN